MATAILVERRTNGRRRSSASHPTPTVPLRRAGRVTTPVDPAAELCERIEYVPTDWRLVARADRPTMQDADSHRLSAEEEAQLFRRMNYLKHRAERLRQRAGELPNVSRAAAGVEGLLAESLRWRNYLVQVFSKLAASVARQYVSGEFRLDELLSEAHVTLLRCVEIFDVDRGYRFSTYATNAIRHNLNRYVARQHRLRQVTREYVAADGLLRDSVSNPGGHEREYSSRMSGVAQWLCELDPREQTIVRSRYGLTDDPERMSLQSLANQLGLSRERIRQLEIRAIEKLRMKARSAKLELDA